MFRVSATVLDHRMFTYPTCDVEVRRTVDFNALTWPAPGEAGDEGTLGCNRSYMDLRRIPWSESLSGNITLDCIAFGASV